MNVVRTVQEGFGVTSQEIEKGKYLEVKLRKGIELDGRMYDDISSRISPRYHDSIFFESGKAVTLAFEKWSENDVHLLGIVLQKEGIIRNEKIGVIKSALVGHPAVTHYNVTYAVPGEDLKGILENAAETLSNFNVKVVKGEPSIGKIKLKLDGNVWVGGTDEGGTRRNMHLSRDRKGEHVELHSEVEKKNSSTDICYTLLEIGRLTTIRFDKPPWAEGVTIEVRETKKRMKELIGSGKAKDSFQGVEGGLHLFEVKENIKSKRGEVTVKYYATKLGRLSKIDIIGPDDTMPIVIMPRKLEAKVRKFLEEDAVQTWLEKPWGKKEGEVKLPILK